MKIWISIFFVLVSLGGAAQQVSDFKLKNVVNNEEVGLSTYPSCEGMVVIFSSNTCPYDEYYRGRISKLATTYNDKVPVLLVNSGTEPADAVGRMAEMAKTLGLDIPYLADKDQKLMTMLDARKSPEAFLLKNDNGKFVVVYRGAIDDNAQVEADVRQNYLRDAIDIMLSNEKVQTPEIRPVGCNLKKKG